MKTPMKRKVEERGTEMTRADVMRGRSSGAGGEVAAR
jgi:hypothetical protein